jgi:hypothetical protein
MKVTIVTTNDPNKAEPNDRTLKPRIMEPANQNSNALITNIKSPNVKRVMGKVRMIKIGFIKAFNKPRNAAPIIAAPRLFTLIPGIKYEARSIAIVIIIHAKRMLMFLLPPTKNVFSKKPYALISEDDYISYGKKYNGNMEGSSQGHWSLQFLKPMLQLRKSSII